MKETVYEGTWEKDQISGYGSLRGVNIKYTGEWKDNKKHGKGKLTWTNEKRKQYIGDFVNDKFYGVGELILANGDTYNGNFLDN